MKTLLWLAVLMSCQSAICQDKLYVTNVGMPKIHRMNPDGSEFETLISGGLHYPEDIAIDTRNSKMYFTDKIPNGNFSIGVVGKANLDGSEAEEIHLQNMDVRKIVVDTLNGFVYWSMGIGTIKRANLNLQNVQNFMTGINGPLNIELDLESGKIYWSSTGDDKIERANLDGSGRELMFTVENNLCVFKLDKANNKIYWCNNAQGKILCANMDGSEAEALVTGLHNVTVIETDFENGKIYWTENYIDGTFLGSSMKRADLDGSNITIIYLNEGLAVPFGLELVKSSTVSTEEAGSEADQITVWPVPFYDHLKIMAPIQQPGSYTITDNSGKMVATGGMKPNTEMTIPTPFPAGCYYLEIRTGDKIFRRKLVKP